MAARHARAMATAVMAIRRFNFRVSVRRVSPGFSPLVLLSASEVPSAMGPSERTERIR